VSTGIVAVVGPTAAGKSELAVALARRLGGEVVNADSMQLYRGMDIGTAKLSSAERAGVPHHLLDVWPVTKSSSVAEYQHLARATIDDLLRHRVVPILVGGSGLYVKAVLDDMAFPGTDETLRGRLEEQLREVGPVALHERLSAVDPVAAADILPTNGRRVVRALEVVQLTGKPFSATLPAYADAAPVYDAVQVGVDVEAADLDARIETRVVRMWQLGLVREVRDLLAEGLRTGRTARMALGYQQVLRYLDGEYDEAEARAHTVRATRRFARRQRSWFRRDPRIRWLDSTDADRVDAALRKIDP
jgi:tRNA dimethylallyltransferase